MVKKNVAIIGAGLSGLVLADRIGEQANVSVFEKARGVGGRMSTRYADDFQFDHGAQFFTARSKGFRDFLKPYIMNDIVQDWTPKVVTLEVGEKPYKRDWFEPHYVASPKMNMLCKHLAEKLVVLIGTKIDVLSKEEGFWFLIDADGNKYGPFDWVVSSAPAPQTCDLFPKTFAHYRDVSDVKMQGCYSLMLGLKDDLKLNWGAAVVKNSPVGWMAVNSLKPARDHDFSLLVQTTNDWAQAHIEDDQDDVRDSLLREVCALIERDIEDVNYYKLHRWRYASTVIDEDKEPVLHFVDFEQNLVAMGDWCVQGHVESAYLSAESVSELLVRYLK